MLPSVPTLHPSCAQRLPGDLQELGGFTTWHTVQGNKEPATWEPKVMGQRKGLGKQCHTSKEKQEA